MSVFVPEEKTESVSDIFVACFLARRKGPNFLNAVLSGCMMADAPSPARFLGGLATSTQDAKAPSMYPVHGQTGALCDGRVLCG